MTTVFEELRADHDVQRRLLDLVSKTHGDSHGRRELFERLKDAVLAHAKAEERVLYAPLLMTTAQEKATHSIREHDETREKLEGLEKMDFSSSAWLSHFEKLREALEHHMDEEEHKFFQQAGRVLADEAKQEMAAQFREEKQAARV